MTKLKDLPAPETMEQFGNFGASVLEVIEEIIPDHYSLLFMIPKDGDDDTLPKIFINAPHEVTVITLSKLLKAMDSEKFKQHQDMIDSLRDANEAREKGQLQ